MRHAVTRPRPVTVFFFAMGTIETPLIVFLKTLERRRLAKRMRRIFYAHGCFTHFTTPMSFNASRAISMYRP